MRARGEGGGGTKDEMVGGITDSKDLSLSKLWEIVKTGKPGVLQFMGYQRVGHNLDTDNNKMIQLVTARR